MTSFTYEDWCALTEGSVDPAEVERLEDERFSLRGEMQVLEIEDVEGQFLGDGDGDDDGADGSHGLVEDVEDALSCLDEFDRAIAVGNALAGISHERATMVVLNWLCFTSETARYAVTKQGAEMLASRFALAKASNDNVEICASHAALCELLAVVSPAAFGGEAE